MTSELGRVLALELESRMRALESSSDEFERGLAVHLRRPHVTDPDRLELLEAWDALNNPDPADHSGRRQLRWAKLRLRIATTEPVYLAAIAERDGWRCGICRTPVLRDPSSGREAVSSRGYRHRVKHPASASLDHVVPLSLGGPHAPSNVRLTHLACNTGLGARLLWLQLPPDKRPSSLPALSGDEAEAHLWADRLEAMVERWERQWGPEATE